MDEKCGDRLILIVDDNADQCRALSTLLRRRGFEVSWAESGAAAMEFVASHRIGLILLDVMMPDMSGLDVLRTIRSNHVFDPVRICMHSAVDDPAWRTEAGHLGAEGYMIKGMYDLDDLYGEIERYFLPSA